MAFEYKCVSGPTIVAVRNTKVRDQAVKAFEDIMNIEAAQGWEFVGIDEFHVSEPQGLFSNKRVYVPAKILVFRREKAGSLLADALKSKQNRVETITTQSETVKESGSTSSAVLAVEDQSEPPVADKKQTISALIEKMKSRKSD